MALAMDLEHGPGCVWSLGGVAFYVAPDGTEWEVADLTKPHVSPECTCGYFALLETARRKCRDAMGQPA